MINNKNHFTQCRIFLKLLKLLYYKLQKKNSLRTERCVRVQERSWARIKWINGVTETVTIILLIARHLIAHVQEHAVRIVTVRLGGGEVGIVVLIIL